MNPAIALVDAPAAPKAIGPYSHAARIGNLLYCSGQIPLDPSTMQLVPGGIEEQTRQALRNVEAVLGSQGATLSNVAKTTLFLAEMSDFPVVNRIYGEAMGEHKPARSTVQVAGLPLGSLIEIEVVAVV